MKKKNNGFTLIELLAIIVILAIIAVITVPIILNVIDNAKRGTAQDSAYGYKDAISKYYVTEMFNNNNITLNGDYTVDSNGVLSNDTERHEILFSGTKPKGGYLTYANNVLTEGCLTIDDYKVIFANGEVNKTDKGTCDSKPTETTYKCKRATSLHEEECKQTDETYYCSGAGYTVTGSKGTTTITYGNIGKKGIIKSGDAFDCDVNDDGTYDPQTERFYYVSDLYNTTTKKLNNEYAVLIYYNNFANGKPDNTTTGLTAYNSNNANYNGPETAKINLPTNDIWKNVNLSNESRSIINQNGEGITGNGTNTLPSAYSYEGYAARLLTTQEIELACNITVGTYTTGEINQCNYLIENTRFSNPNLASSVYWIETAFAGDSSGIWYVNGHNRSISSNNASSNTSGVRPAIEVLKTDIEI